MEVNGLFGLKINNFDLFERKINVMFKFEKASNAKQGKIFFLKFLFAFANPKQTFMICWVYVHSPFFKRKISICLYFLPFLFHPKLCNCTRALSELFIRHNLCLMIFTFSHFRSQLFLRNITQRVWYNSLIFSLNKRFLILNKRRLKFVSPTPFLCVNFKFLICDQLESNF